MCLMFGQKVGLGHALCWLLWVAQLQLRSAVAESTVLGLSFGGNQMRKTTAGDKCRPRI